MLSGSLCSHSLPPPPPPPVSVVPPSQILAPTALAPYLTRVVFVDGDANILINRSPAAVLHLTASLPGSTILGAVTPALAAWRDADAHRADEDTHIPSTHTPMGTSSSLHVVPSPTSYQSPRQDRRARHRYASPAHPPLTSRPQYAAFSAWFDQAPTTNAPPLDRSMFRSAGGGDDAPSIAGALGDVETEIMKYLRARHGGGDPMERGKGKNHKGKNHTSKSKTNKTNKAKQKARRHPTDEDAEIIDAGAASGAPTPRREKRREGKGNNHYPRGAVRSSNQEGSGPGGPSASGGTRSSHVSSGPGGSGIQNVHGNPGGGAGMSSIAPPSGVALLNRRGDPVLGEKGRPRQKEGGRREEHREGDGGYHDRGGGGGGGRGQEGESLGSGVGFDQSRRERKARGGKRKNAEGRRPLTTGFGPAVTHPNPTVLLRPSSSSPATSTTATVRLSTPPPPPPPPSHSRVPPPPPPPPPLETPQRHEEGGILGLNRGRGSGVRGIGRGVGESRGGGGRGRGRGGRHGGGGRGGERGHNNHPSSS